MVIHDLRNPTNQIKYQITKSINMLTSIKAKYENHKAKTHDNALGSVGSAIISIGGS
jgi:hypothetical protein